MLNFIFGALQDNKVHVNDPLRASGYLEYERARVRWFLSVDERDLPASQHEAGQRTFRSITVDGQEIEFSGGFTDLHTQSYELIVAGEGFGLESSRCAIETVAAIRTMAPSGAGERHPLAGEPK